MAYTVARFCSRIAVVLAVLSAAADAHAQDAHAQRAVPDASLRAGTLSFLGHSTLGDFVGKTDQVHGEVIGSANIATARGWVEAPVRALKTGNGRRDRDLRKSMEAERYPTLRFDLTGMDAVSPAPAGTVRATLHGRLAVHGVARDVALPATLAVAADTIRVMSVFPLHLKDYRIGGLSKLLGILEMQERIEVGLDLRFVDTPRAASANRTP
jgi:polyisoprenoid-binding protein YceI